MSARGQRRGGEGTSRGRPLSLRSVALSQLELGRGSHRIGKVYCMGKNIFPHTVHMFLFQKNIYFCFIDYIKAFDCVEHNKLWKILKEMGIPDHLTCLLRNLYAGQEATVRTGHGTTDSFLIRKGVHQGCILSPCFFNFYAEYIMRNAGLEEAQAGIDCQEKYQ